VPEDDRPPGVDPLRPLAPPTWRERLEDAAQLVGTPGRAIAFALLLVGVAVAAFAVLRPAPSGPAPELSLPMASSSPATSTATSTEQTVLVVHAAGAVNAPGLYRVPSGSRVDDLISAAGGLAEDADRDRINLAAPLADGERVYIPRAGEAVPPAEGPAPAGGSASSGPIDLNTATVDELDSLPGIGPSIAKAIVDERERNGPFRSVDDLERVRGIGPSKLDQIRALVTV
jgi:competence protein ComEA